MDNQSLRSRLGEIVAEAHADAPLFICYSHDDAETVQSDAAWLVSRGFSTWLDKRIQAGTDWADELTRELDRCVALIFFASQRAIASPHCLNEIAYAVDAGKPIVVVYLESVELTGGIKLFVARTQAIVRWQLGVDEYRQQMQDVLRGHTDGVSTAAPSAPIDYWQVPMRRNHGFSGREELLATLGTALQQTPDPAVLVLAGLAGVGKSQLALEFAYRHARGFRVVAWIRAEATGTLDADFVQLAKGLHIEGANGTDTALVVEGVKRWLADHGDWLLILDNVEDPKLAAAYLPRQFCGKALVTTRRQNWGHWVRRFPVDGFSPAEAVDFLIARTREADHAAAADLAQALGCLPLALEEAAAYIEATGRSIASYLRLFNENHTLLLAHDPTTEEYPWTLRAAFEVSLKQVAAEDPFAARLLDMLAFVAPDDIPRTLWETAFPDAGDHEPAPLRVDRCLAALRKYSLVSIHGDAISVHRLVQLVIRDRLSAHDRDAIVADVLRQVEAVFPHVRDMGSDAAESLRLLPHAVAVLEHAQGIAAVAVTAGLLWGRTGTILSARNASTEAATHLERAYSLFHNDAEHRRMFARTSELYGRILYHNGQLHRARTVYEEALSAYRSTEGGNSIRLMQIYVDLAWIGWTSGDFVAAAHASERALEVLQVSAGPDDPRAMAGLSILARVQMEQGRIEDSRRTIATTIQAIEALGGYRMPLMCGVFFQVAHVLLHLGLPLRAISWAQESINLGKPFFSQHHALMAASRCVLGQALLTLGELEPAQAQLAATAETVGRSAHPLNQHIWVATCQLVDVLATLGNLDEARRLAVEAGTSLDSGIAGDAVFARAHGAAMRARLLVLDGDHAQAQRLLTDADTSMSNHYGAEHLYRLPLLRALGDLELQRGLADDAARHHEVGIALARRHDLMLHPGVADHLLGLADVATHRADAGRAAELKRQALDIYRQRLGPSSKRVLAFGALA